MTTSSSSRRRAALYLRAENGEAVSLKVRLGKLAQEHGLEIVLTCEDSPSGRSHPARERLLNATLSGDVEAVLLPTIAILGDTPTRALETLAQMAGLGIEVRSLAEGWLAEVGPGLVHVAGWLQAQEATRRSTRARVSIETARKKGRKPGRPRKIDRIDLAKVETLLAQGLPLSAVARHPEIKVGLSTLRRALASQPAPDPASTKLVAGTSIEGAFKALTGGAQ